MNLFVIWIPFISFVFSGLLSFYINSHEEKKLFYNFIAWIVSIILLFITFLFYLFMLFNIVKNQDVLIINWLNWFVSGNIFVSLSIIYNSLTLTMLLLISFVSLLVHFYSYFYLDKNENIARFLSYLTLFTFSMMILVSANDLMQMFIGWEAISLCSYLLILYWFKEKHKVFSANKAFLINRFADIAFIFGIFSTISIFGNLSFSQFTSDVESVSTITFNIFSYNIYMIDVICILFLIASFAKSAQLFFHIWLPDAMEAPTPVSALLHAATMVTAGVFLTIKLAPLYEYSTISLNIVLIVSSITALFGSLMACVQNDIKKIIAYSTISQLGYMFLAIGVSFYNGAIFHLFTHAFFKALLFLSAGSVIHAMHHEQNIYNMGDLWRKIPITYVSFLIGTFALLGIPYFSGSYSKEAILNALLFTDKEYASFAYYMGLITIFFSAFYSFRLLFIVFHSKSNDSHKDSVHESKIGMIMVLLILSVLSMVSGSMLYNIFIGEYSSIYWNDSLLYTDITSRIPKAHIVEIISMSLVFIAFIITYFLYIKKSKSLVKFVNDFQFVHVFLTKEFYINDLYKNLFVNYGSKVSKFLFKNDDNIVEKYTSNFTASFLYYLSNLINRFQNGYINFYAVAMMLGFFAIITYFIFIIGL